MNSPDADLRHFTPVGREQLERVLRARARPAVVKPPETIKVIEQSFLSDEKRESELVLEPWPTPQPDDFAEPVTLWLPLPPSWNRVFKARAMPLGGGKFTAQVYKSSEGKAYEKSIAELAKVEGLSPWPKTQMLRFSGVVAMERAGCDMDDRLKVFFDALKGVLFDDDEQVAEYGQVRRIVDSKRPGITATFEPIAVDRYGEPTQPTLFAPPTKGA